MTIRRNSKNSTYNRLLSKISEYLEITSNKFIDNKLFNLTIELNFAITIFVDFSKHFFNIFERKSGPNQFGNLADIMKADISEQRKVNKTLRIGHVEIHLDDA